MVFIKACQKLICTAPPDFAFLPFISSQPRSKFSTVTSSVLNFPQLWQLKKAYLIKNQQIYNLCSKLVITWANVYFSKEFVRHRHIHNYIKIGSRVENELGFLFIKITEKNNDLSVKTDNGTPIYAVIKLHDLYYL